MPSQYKFKPGDLAKVVEAKYTAWHFFPVGAVVRIGKRINTPTGHFTQYYCTEESTGLTQRVPSCFLEKIE